MSVSETIQTTLLVAEYGLFFVNQLIDGEGKKTKMLLSCLTDGMNLVNSSLYFVVGKCRIITTDQLFKN